MPQVREVLARHGRLDGAVFGAALGLPDEQVGPAARAVRRAPYLSTVIVPARPDQPRGASCEPAHCVSASSAPARAPPTCSRCAPRSGSPRPTSSSGPRRWCTRTCCSTPGPAPRSSTAPSTRSRASPHTTSGPPARGCGWRASTPATRRCGARTQEQHELCTRLGLDDRGVPGVSSFSAVAALVQRELTIPEVAQSVVLTRLEGGKTPMPPRETVRAFAEHGTTMALFLSAARTKQLQEELLRRHVRRGHPVRRRLRRDLAGRAGLRVPARRPGREGQGAQALQAHAGARRAGAGGRRDPLAPVPPGALPRAPQGRVGSEARARAARAATRG